MLIGGGLAKTANSEEANDRRLEEGDRSEDDTEGIQVTAFTSQPSPLNFASVRKAPGHAPPRLSRDAIIVIRTQQRPAGPARGAPFTDPQAGPAPRQPPARRAGESVRHASLPAAGEPTGRQPARGLGEARLAPVGSAAEG